MSKKQAEELKPNKAKENIKKFVEGVKTIPNIWTNTQHLIEALCLLIVAGFAFWSSFKYAFAVQNAGYVLRFASVVIGLRGMYELLKQMNKRGE